MPILTPPLETPFCLGETFQLHRSITLVEPVNSHPAMQPPGILKQCSVAMIKARLLPASLKQDVVVDAYRQVLREGRLAVANSRRASRLKALRYAKYLRSRGFTKGYQEGLSAARADTCAALDALRGCYNAALFNAQQDIQTLAQQLAIQFIDASIVERPEIFARWVQQAIATLKRSRSLHLGLNPRYDGILSSIVAHLPAGISVTLNPDADPIDFRLEGEFGGIEFAWREVITPSALQQPSSIKLKHIE
jgi:flagellar biosynthesis/type III secretory pathway protein FliH